MKIEHHPAVEDELRHIIEYYNQRVPGLGTSFLSDFDHQIVLIAANPEIWAAISADIRCSLLKRFPYAVYFRVTQNRGIRVIVVKHQKRHPAYGIRRK